MVILQWLKNALLFFTFSIRGFKVFLAAAAKRIAD